METTGWKIISIIFILLIGVVGVALPKVIRVEVIFLDAFAAGVILVVAIMHLEAEAEKMFHDLDHRNHTNKYHGVAGALSVSTFIIMLIIQELATKFFGDGVTPADSPSSQVDLPNSQTDSQSTTASKQDDGGKQDDDIKEKKEKKVKFWPWHSRDDDDRKKMLSSISPCGHSHNLSEESKDNKNTVVGTMCLFIALGVHCIIEGVALGALPKSKDVQIIFWSIFAHKGLAGFALGKTLLQANLSNKMFVLMSTLFAVFTPLGIGIGWACVTDDPEKTLPAAIFTAIAAGTFMSVALYEVIPELFYTAGRVYEKLLGISVGTVSMILILLFIPHEAQESN